MAKDLLKENTNKALVSMSVPISLGMLSTFLFQVVDTYFVGQLGPDALAALSFSSTIYFLIVGVFIGFAVGVSIIVGKSAGEKNTAKVKQTAMVGIILCFVLSGMSAYLIIESIDKIFTGLGASSELIPLIESYMVPLLIGIPLLTVGITCGGILRATGNATMPEVIMGIAGIINLVFDYGLIFGHWGLPEMGIQGAAYATVISWVFVILGMIVLLLKDKLFTLKFTTNISSTIKEIFALGSPTIATQAIAPITAMFITYLLARQSELAVAAYGVASRIEMLVLIGILGVSTAITPFIAQNAGARAQNRIDEAIAFGGKASTYLGILTAVILVVFIKPIATIFSDDVLVIEYTSYYFYFIAFSYIFYGLFLITTSIFNGLQLPVNSLKIMLIRSLLITIPFAWVGSVWGVFGVFIGISISNVLAGVYASYEMRKYFSKTGSELARVNVWKEYKNDVSGLWKLVIRKSENK